MRNVTEIQRYLISQGYLAATDEHGKPNDDGKFGTVTLAAYNRARAAKGEPPHTGLLLLTEINADLFGEETAPPPTRRAATPHTSIFDQIGAIASIINLLKGKTMTKDQIEGTIRTVLAALAAYLAGKGYFPQISPELLTAITTVLVGAWSLWSNRPKVIQPIGK